MQGPLAQWQFRCRCRRFLRVTGGRDIVYIAQLQQMPELSGNPFIPHIFQLFDADNDGAVNIDEFTKGVEYLATLGDPEEQYKCVCACACRCPALLTAHSARMAAVAFKMYDTDGDGFIRQAELFSMLKHLGLGNVSDAQLDQVCVVLDGSCWCGCIYTPTVLPTPVTLLQVVKCTIEEFDRDGDHALSLAEFKNLTHTIEIQNKLALGMA
jgi:hypothetical protein